MMLGYGTVGALIASRVAGNPIGWLMLAVALGFVLSGLTDEYVRYTYLTEPGALPYGLVAAWLTNWVFSIVFTSIPLVLLLFPTGRVPSPRWRPLPIVISRLARSSLFSSC